MKISRTSTGSDVLDRLLEGGLENDILTTIYGPAGSGKTTTAMICAISIAKTGKKTVFIDTEGGFSPERLNQLCGADVDIPKRILVMHPLDFQEQMKTLHNLSRKISSHIGLVVIDTISMLYRTELSATKDIKHVNNELGLQISWLTEIARRNRIPVLAINQVYADFDSKDKVKMVGGDILRYSSKCLIELLNLNNGRKAVIKKHRSLPENKEVTFRIIQEGFIGID
ncbi:DNA repair and recombination protein RadB [Candidatus Woesearchaeota archaeon]|nr:DNA repair and recombination protein RadB [Candidatus Woesearchaeota archaeon]